MLFVAIGLQLRAVFVFVVCFKLEGMLKTIAFVRKSVISTLTSCESVSDFR